ncbi:MAG: hypothetical protein ACRD22_16540, partial [Terriglobia bacterium]
MAYNQITFAQIRSQLLIRLSDPSGVFWSNTSNGSGFNECSGYITEAMQTWSALTGYWRDRAAINPAQGFIDTQILMNGAGESLCPRTTTDARILAAMEFNLLEPATPSSYSGSEMFTQQALLQALQNRRDQFLLGTGITINRSTQITNLSRPVLDPSIIAVRRADWNSSLLYPVDEFELAAFLPTWSSSPGTPQG